MNYKHYHNVWVDSWSTKRHAEVMVRYTNQKLMVGDTIGLGIEVMPRTFELWYNPWLCRFCFSIWLFSVWFCFPRMAMVAKACYTGKFPPKKKIPLSGNYETLRLPVRQS